MSDFARRVFVTLVLVAGLGACYPEPPEPSATVTRGERTATAVERDGIYYASVVESGRVVFEVEARSLRARGATFGMRLLEHAAVVLADEVRLDEGAIVGVEDIANFALAAYHFKSRERRHVLGLPVAQDRPGCDAVVASCGQHGICCDRHDKCLEDANDTSQSRSQMRLRKSNNCDLEAVGCVAATAAGIGAGPSDCCRIPGPGSPTCSPAGTYVDRCGSNNCCNGAVDAFTGGFCSSSYSPGYCINGPNPEPYPFCQLTEQEWSTWGGHGPPNYWSNARCGDGVCSPGESPSSFDSYDGNCKSDCGAVTPPPCDWHDCEGTCNGGVWNDACGVCGGDGTSCGCTWYDCQGTCNGGVWNDACGVCGGDGSSCACGWYDCQGTCNGSASTDACGVCGGDGSSCLP